MIALIQSLPQDIIIHIAAAFEQNWYILYQCDPLFAQFAQTTAGIRRFTREFTQKHININNISYKLFDKFHRIDDLPAIEYTNGAKDWYIGGYNYREGDKPAFVGCSGRQIWYKHGEIHREGDLPAIIDVNGKQQWRKNGKNHRECGPAIIQADGYVEYWIDGERINT